MRIDRVTVNSSPLITLFRAGLHPLPPKIEAGSGRLSPPSQVTPLILPARATLSHRGR